MSGRGLGFTGGTIDKLESIPGFQTNLPTEAFLRNTKEIGCCVVAQSGSLVPADKKMYSLRNLTATVDSIPLICASIMSKKLALGADCILLDVKYGSGAFMKTPEEAKKLAEAMVTVGRQCGKKCRAVITNMNTPLGAAVGNALEVEEVIRIMRGEANNSLKSLSLSLAAQMLSLSGKGELPECYKMAQEALQSGRALEKFSQMIAAQAGDASVTEHPERLPKARVHLSVLSKKKAFISEIQSEETGLACLELGAGRTNAHPEIDAGAGVVFHRSTGDAVSVGDPLFTVHGSSQSACEKAAARIQSAISFSTTPVSLPPLIYDVIS
jgi:pyrimidine-nucleoside phosphorylase